jgi:chlorobactene glucosyltransferase
MLPFLLALPWLGLLLFVLFVARIPRALPEEAVPRGGVAGEGAAGEGAAGEGAVGEGAVGDDAVGELAGAGTRVPTLSVIVPARNEAVNIIGCLRSITASAYPDFEVLVVDDRSDDHTGELARSVPAGNARRLLVLDGEPLPEGWLGKPWACHQAARHARGELLLFTDADTTHAPLLTGRAVAALEEDEADLLTVAGRQLMETFWERLVQPYIFLLMLIRFPDFERVARNDRWRDAIANGQFLLFRRSAYEAIGGHEAVRDEVAEDLALAQYVKRAGLQLRIRSTETDLATRMYRSLGQLVEGWSKNIVMGGLQAFPVPLRPLVPPVSLLGGVGLWLVAPGLLLLAAALGLTHVGGAPGPSSSIPGGLVAWAGTVYGVSVLLWAHFSRKMGAPFYYGALYPLGAAVGSFIFLRAWIRGRTVEWKGRRYRLRPVSERA